MPVGMDALGLGFANLGLVGVTYLSLHQTATRSQRRVGNPPPTQPGSWFSFCSNESKSARVQEWILYFVFLYRALDVTMTLESNPGSL